MKKAYMTPAVATIPVAPQTLCATSLKLDSSEANQLKNEDDFLSKEQNTWNIWDE